MKKMYIYIAAAVIVIIAGLAVYIAMNQKSNTNSMNMNSSNGPIDNSSTTSSITIQNFTFAPVNTSVKVGTKVTWTNNDSTTHTVTETDSQTGPNSGNLDPGSSYSFTFTKPGIYHYHCAIHPDMTGTVTVN